MKIKVFLDLKTHPHGSVPVNCGASSFIERDILFSLPSRFVEASCMAYDDVGCAATTIASIALSLATQEFKVWLICNSIAFLKSLISVTPFFDSVIGNPTRAQVDMP